MRHPKCPACDREWDSRADLCPVCGLCRYSCCQHVTARMVYDPPESAYGTPQDAEYAYQAAQEAKRARWEK